MSYPAPIPPQVPVTPAPAPGGARRTITIITALVGALALVGILTTTVGKLALSSFGQFDGSYSSPVTGLEQISINSSAAGFTVQYADVQEAKLDVVNSSRGWKLSLDGPVLSVRPVGDTRFCILCSNTGQVTLTLPKALDTTDVALKINLSAGQLSAQGEFKDVDVQVAAGSANLNFKNAQNAAFDLAAGQMSVSLVGTPPAVTKLSVAAGTMTVGLPNQEYDFRGNAAAGTISNGLRINPQSNHRVEADVAAGSLSLISGN